MNQTNIGVILTVIYFTIGIFKFNQISKNNNVLSSNNKLNKIRDLVYLIDHIAAWPIFLFKKINYLANEIYLDGLYSDFNKSIKLRGLCILTASLASLSIIYLSKFISIYFSIPID